MSSTRQGREVHRDHLRLADSWVLGHMGAAGALYLCGTHKHWVYKPAYK